ncbi:MAG: 16S rRNA processing protein RimM [Acidimicrobiia bacterium]|nr:16S rRNA processing protein RimM [Acidimicrobiia bacterium]
MNSSTDDRISVGYVRRAHGIRGDVIVRPLTDFEGRFVAGSEFLTDESPSRSLRVTRAQDHKDGYLVHFDAVTSRNDAEALQGVTFTISASERRDLGENEFWPEDLQGMVAITPNGDRLGTVVGVVLGEAQDRLVVSTADGVEIEVPFVDPIVSVVHPSGGHVVIDAPPGLFEAPTAG